MSANLALALQFEGQYDPAVASELNQLIAAIQGWANGLSGAGKWTDVPFNSSMFSANNVGSISVLAARPYLFQFAKVGDTLIVQVTLRVSVLNATTNAIRINLPGGFKAQPYPDPSTANQAGSGGIWDDANVSAAGVVAVLIDPILNQIVIERWDGVAAANFPQRTCFMHATAVIRIKDVAEFQ